MSLHKMFSVLCLASVIASGCGGEPATSERDAVQQGLRGDGWTNSNYNQLFSATLDGQTVTGLYYAGGMWFVSTSSSLTYAQVSSIAYNGQVIDPRNLTTGQGTFQVIGADSEDAGVELVLTVAAPLAGTLRITSASVATDGSFGRYSTEWLPASSDDPSAAVGLCPREVLVAGSSKTATQTQVVYETMIPIGGVRWSLNGSKTSDANAITLGCSHDAIGGCVEWGYGPWGTRSGVSMASVHQACTRMKRDDVCGSGSPLTTGYDAAQGWLAESTNLGAIQLLNRLRSPRQLVVYPTTNSGYGTKTGDVYCTEETPLEPISLYGRTKADAETELLNSPNAITLRLATVFGLSPRMRLDLLVNHFVYAALMDRYLVIFEKDFKRNYIHIRDVAEAFLHCLSHAETMLGRPYNVGLDAANLSKEELALKIKEYVPNFYIHFAEFGTDPDKRNYIVSNQRLREAGFEARRSLDDGIRELLKGYAMLGRQPFKNV